MIAAHLTGAFPALPARVLVAVDDSRASRLAIAYARDILAHGGKLRLVSVAENPRTLVPTGRLAQDVMQRARAELLSDAADALEHAKEVFAECDVRIETELIDLSKRGGNVVDALVGSAVTWQADLLVAGARQHHGVLRWIEGTVSEPLAKLSRCPILIVPEHFDVELGRLPARILFALDASQPALEALRYGIRFATRETDLHAIYVVDRAMRVGGLLPNLMVENAFIEEGSATLAAAKPILERISARASTALVESESTGDDVAHAIVRAADNWHAELIVMGTHGRRGMARWILGSVAQRVAQLTHAPLLLVHAQER
jgi:nucleotide-binding universal stress UspA family protein